MMTEQEFRDRSEAAMDELEKLLAKAGDEHDFEVDNNGGALTVSFDDGGTRFVVSPNSPVRQIWISAHLRSSKLDWDDASDVFVLNATGQSLLEVMSDAVSKQLGDTITL